MAKDKKNIWQETPNQLRQKVKKFISIPEHFAEYCKPRGMLLNDEEKQSVAIWTSQKPYVLNPNVICIIQFIIMRWKHSTFCGAPSTILSVGLIYNTLCASFYIYFASFILLALVAIILQKCVSLPWRWWNKRISHHLVRKMHILLSYFCRSPITEKIKTWKRISDSLSVWNISCFLKLIELNNTQQDFQWVSFQYFGKWQSCFGALKLFSVYKG